LLKAQSNEDDLVKQHMRQVRAIARNIRRKFPHSEPDDFIGYGLLGWDKAIRGEILDALRNMQPLSRTAYAKKKMELTDEECAASTTGCAAVPVQQKFNNQLGDERTIQHAEAGYVQHEYLLLHALSRLPPCNRELIRLRYEHDWNWQMVAERMNVTLWKAMQLHNAALKRLRHLLTCS
jgi:RNA polymerase sigma factor (sigma-70 family)